MRADLKRQGRLRRHRRVRKNVSGTAERPRLAIYRSNRHIYAQLIDDADARTLAAASDLDEEAKRFVRIRYRRLLALGALKLS